MAEGRLEAGKGSDGLRKDDGRRERTRGVRCCDHPRGPKAEVDRMDAFRIHPGQGDLEDGQTGRCEKGGRSPLRDSSESGEEDGCLDECVC